MIPTETRQEQSETWLIQSWSESAATVLQDLLHQELTAEWNEVTNPSAVADLEARWWRFHLDGGAAPATIWVGVPNATGAQLASLASQLAGGDIGSADNDVVLPATLGKVARSVAERMEQQSGSRIEVSGPEMSDTNPDIKAAHIASLSRGSDLVLEMIVAVEPSAGEPAAEATDARIQAWPEPEGEVRSTSDPSPAFDLISSIEVPIHVVFGTAELSLRDVSRLGPGSLVELDCSCDDPVEVVVNDRVVARGTVVVIDGNYGVKIQEVIGPGRNGGHGPNG